MIRSLARNGLVERSITATQRSSVTRRPLGYTQAPLCFNLDRPLYGSDPTFLLSSARLLSTTSSSTEKPPGSSPESVQLPTPKPVTRKPKIDLKPAPVKLTKLPQSNTVPSASTPTPSDKSSATASKAKDGSSTTLTAAQLALRTAEDAKARDIAEAIKHGILAPPPAGAGTVRRAVHQIWELMKFYFRGIRMVMRNSQRTKEMQKRVAEGGHPLSRWETRFIQAYRQDMKRLIPFLLIVLVIEEIVPLIALYAPGMLPSTCILPSQRQRIQEKRRERLTAVVDVNQVLLAKIERLAGDSGIVTPSQLDPYATSILSTILDASSIIPLNAMRRQKITKKLTEIYEDDTHLIREDFGKRLTAEEVTEALEERGMCPLEQSRLLRWWLKGVTDVDETNAISRRVALIALAGLRKTGS
ncbi:hypothetical protein NEOLEDRAFT_1233244 [Neolentinus lepideus HHB14362 ss-1]|uniref:Letm1 RBD domain-containing protein n=1 Tax=Neolentinus lepideus HHB14362 ss-1 TaxID=1314782 RepID=A0A165UDC1_9AGAM|nr:hypothetical protein NEOLEDRAFT_1233244 [Neolentinus lepideus HHB14362 ss-1]